jgi:ethanolamine utilization microcompartment shell protein EutS
MALTKTQTALVAGAVVFGAASLTMGFLPAAKGTAVLAGKTISLGGNAAEIIGGKMISLG